MDLGASTVKATFWEVRKNPTTYLARKMKERIEVHDKYSQPEGTCSDIQRDSLLHKKIGKPNRTTAVNVLTVFESRSCRMYSSNIVTVKKSILKCPKNLNVLLFSVMAPSVRVCTCFILWWLITKTRAKTPGEIRSSFKSKKHWALTGPRTVQSSE